MKLFAKINQKLFFYFVSHQEIHRNDEEYKIKIYWEEKEFYQS